MVEEPGSRRPLSRVEFEQLAGLLARYCETRLDQWEAWRLTTSNGEVFVDISRELLYPRTRDAYTPI